MIVPEALKSACGMVGLPAATMSAARGRDHAAVRAVRQRAPSYRNLADRQIAEGTKRLQEAVQTGIRPTAEEIILDGFALVTEAIRRALGICLYDVQLLAGLALSRGRIVEMQTGEGKTFVAALPAYVHALAGRGVHIMTVNDYLAKRDYGLLAPVFSLLGMSVSMVQPSGTRESKRQAYACDVTYGPGYEFGFDYLRDQSLLLATCKPRLGTRYRNRLNRRRDPTPQTVQRELAFCVVDEVDSVLIDEATTPLLLAEGGTGTEAHVDTYLLARQAADSLTEDLDFVIDPIANRVSLTEAGIRNTTETGRCAAGYGLLRPWTVYVRHALHAQRLLQRDVDYTVVGDKVHLVDKNTGRIHPERSLRDGLHQAVEAKEGLAITAETRPLGHVSRQRFFRLYQGSCGMTGTAKESERELRYFYHLRVAVVPPHRQCQRKQLPTRYFASQSAKFAAIIDEIKRVHATGQPILVGTRTIETSEMLANDLNAQRIPFRLLNGKQDDQEARIVARAGESGAVTIATNMAGRGTDIPLGPGVTQLGGLHVIGTERHESARVDRQLIGRAARQGNPGSCQFFVSADDSLIAQYSPALRQRMRRSAGRDGEVRKDYSRQIAKLQYQVEQTHFAQRQQMFAHDHWLENVLTTLAEE